MLRHEEGVLHVAGGMVGGKVHLGEHVVVVFHLGAVGKDKAHARENVDNLIGDDGERMAGTQLDGVGGACQVQTVVLGVGGLKLLLQGGQPFGGGLFQFVDLHAHLFFLLGGHISEISHQGTDDTLFAEILQSQSLQFGGVGGVHVSYFFEKFCYSVKHLNVGYDKILCKDTIFMAKIAHNLKIMLYFCRNLRGGARSEYRNEQIISNVFDLHAADGGMSG